MTKVQLRPETLALHAAYRRDETTRSVAVPIYQTVAYQFDDTAHAASLFGLEKFGNIYTRIMNPTSSVLEERITALEGGVGALAVSSGQSATAFSIQNLARNGDNIVSSSDLYGGIWNLFANGMKDMGIEVRFVDSSDPENFRRASDDRTRAFYGETLANPKLYPFPIREISTISDDLGIPLIIDNTAAPILCRPFDLGAHIIVYSLTKYIGGHGNSIGGLIVDSGRFDWGKYGSRFPTLNSPDANYHGTIFSEAVKPLGPIAYILRARVVLLRDFGSALSPMNSFLLLQGLETLPLRMSAICDNAQVIAEFLLKHKAVSRVVYPGLFEGTEREHARAVLSGGFGGLIGFELKGGVEAGKCFIDSLRLVYHVANIGDVRTLAIHPASTTQSQLSAEDRVASGASDGYVRLSVGIEHREDLLADIGQALDACCDGER